MLAFPVTNMGSTNNQVRPLISPINTSTASTALASHTVSGNAGPNSMHFDLTTTGSFQPMPGMLRTGSYSAGATFPVESFSSNLSHVMNYFSSGSDDDRYDDVVMTNVLSFDIKVWDPGAPVFDVPVPASSVAAAVATSISTSIAPGDPGYNSILYNAFITQNPPTFTAASPTASNVSFGAYVDLNYMQRVTNVDPYNGLYRWLPTAPVSTATTGNATTFPVMCAKGNYEVALRRYESAQSLPIGSLPRPHFSGPGDPRSGVYGLWPGNPAMTYTYTTGLLAGATLTAANGEDITINRPIAAVYDTWSTHYERDGLANNIDPYYGIGLISGKAINPFYDGSSHFAIDPQTNGIDDDNINGIDDPGEAEAPPPYPYPLRGVQIKIRCFEPDTKQIREVTVTHKFVPD